MNRESSRRRVFFAAAGLATSVVIAGCGHARGERATNEAAANPPAAETAPASSGVTSNANSANNPKATGTVNASVTTPTARVSAIRRRSYSVSAVPEENPTVYVSNTRTAVRTDVTDPIDNMSANPSPAAATAAVCFAPVFEVSSETYTPGTPDGIRANENVIDDFEGPKVPRSDQSMAEVPVTTVTTTERFIVPCVANSDNPENRGVAAGAFMNDAQVMHAALMANSIDSAVSAAAVQRTQNPLVRDYANMMVRDHTAGNQKLAELIDRLKLAPAENDLSNDMLRDVAALSATAPAEPDRDTLHLSNRFVAPANMQPWSSLLSGTSGSAPVRANVNVPDETKPGDRVAVAVVTPGPEVAAGVPAVSDFDRQYVNYQVRFHQKVLDALDTRLIPWAGPEERAALEEARPKVVAHLEAARNLQRALNQNNATH